jgi:hypothetical protein
VKFNLVGPTYRARNVAIDQQLSMNVYTETNESGGGRSPKSLVARPGLQLFCTLPNTPVRALFAGENRLFAVGGSHLYELTSGTPSDRSTLSGATTIGNDGTLVSAVLNGNQLGLASAGDFYCDSGAGPVAIGFTPGLESGTPLTTGAGTSTTSLTIASSGSKTLTTQTGLAFGTADIGENYQGDRIRISSSASPGNYMVGVCTAYNSSTGSLTVTVLQSEGSGTFSSWNVLLAVPAVQCGWLDGLGVVQQSYNSKYFNTSMPLDMTSWDPLDYAQKEAYPDSLAGMLVDHEELWLWGIEGTTEVWRSSGAAPPAFPFQRDPGALIHYGCYAPFSPCRLNNGVAWLSSDQSSRGRGGPFAVYAQGYQPVRVSTHAIEAAWAAYAEYRDAISDSFIQNGHHFWQIHFPSANATWVYDATEGEWHQRGHWNGSSWDRTLGYLHAYTDLGPGPRHFVADWSTGNIYIENYTTTTDNGDPVYWRRVAPYLADDEKPLFQQRLQVDAAQALTMWLEYSDDYGATWSTKKYPRPLVSTPRQGYRYTWSRLGQGKHRVYRVTGTGAGEGTALIGAYMRGAEGAD